jgi:hypothetical protein
VSEQQCNRSSCRAYPALWWNTSTRAYYCQRCALRINDVSPSLCVPPQDRIADLDERVSRLVRDKATLVKALSSIAAGAGEGGIIPDDISGLQAWRRCVEFAREIVTAASDPRPATGKDEEWVTIVKELAELPDGASTNVVVEALRARARKCTG